MIIVLVTGSCRRAKGIPMSNDDVAIQFEEVTYDFGDVDRQDSVLHHTYVFKNTGRKPLLIQGVETNCGCTTVTFPHQPIPSGETGEINVMVHASELVPGQFDKEVRIYTNTQEGLNKLRIRGNIQP